MKATDEQFTETIRRLTSDMGYPPTVREIGEALGIASPASVRWRLMRLRDAGLVAYEDHRARTVRVVE